MIHKRHNTNLSRSKYPGLSRIFRALPIVTISVFAAILPALSTATESTTIPHVGKRALNNYTLYQKADNHKAFAIAPGGAWSWNAEMASVEEAETQTLENCQRATQQKCVLYAVDEQIVFNTEKWPTLWAPYVTAKASVNAPRGVRVGDRFYNIAYNDNKGNEKTLSDSRGKLVLLHFWGSWCPPCMREFPELKKLHTQLNTTLSDNVDMIFLQVREPFTKSQHWAKTNGFASLPLYDSGSKSSYDSDIRLASKGKIVDRELARVFPSTYILDRNGIVLFSHNGPIENWQEYIPFLKHAVRYSAKQVPSKYTMKGNVTR